MKMLPTSLSRMLALSICSLSLLSTAHAQCTDVTNTGLSTGFTGLLPTQFVGQSFTATCTGFMVGITVVSENTNPVTGTLRVFSGDPETGSEVTSRAFAFSTAGTQQLTLNTPMPVTNGGVYSFAFEVASAANGLAEFNTNPYADGSVYIKNGSTAGAYVAQGTLDLHFVVDLEEQVDNGLTGLPATAVIQAGAFGGSGESFVGTYGYGIYRFTNDGWVAKNNGLSNYWIYGLVMSGTTLYAGTWGNGVYTSTDLGENWTDALAPGTHVRGLAATSAGVIYATGDFSEVWKLESGTWTQVGTIADYPTEPWGLAINPSNESHLFASTRYGLFESTDAGATWTQTITGQQAFAVAVHPTAHDVLVGTATGVLKRASGGTTFSPLLTSASPVYTLAFDRHERLYVGHWGPPGVQVSLDNGNTWTTLALVPPDIIPPPLAASKTGSNDTRVVSILVNPFDDTVIVSTEDGSVYVFDDIASIVSNDTPTEIPGTYALDQNYPNPFNPATVIDFEVPEASDVRIAVYDVLGRVVQVLHEGITAAGHHAVTFDAQNLPSGIYMYRMESGNEVITRMMTLMK